MKLLNGCPLPAKIVDRDQRRDLAVPEVIQHSPADRASALQGHILGRVDRKRFHSIQTLRSRSTQAARRDSGTSSPPRHERERLHDRGSNGSYRGESGVIRVLVGSRSSVVREGLESVIRSIDGLEFAGTVDLSRLSPSELSGDVLLIEVGDSSDHDWPAVADLPIPVVLLLDSADSSLLSSALRSGIRGAISWDATPEEIEGAVRAVNAGLVVTTPASLTELLPDAPPLAEETAEPLSDRELEVLDLLAEGLSNKLIAHRLSISEHTVKTHVASIFAKLGASSRTEAVSRAIRRGLVML